MDIPPKKAVPCWGIKNGVRHWGSLILNTSLGGGSKQGEAHLCGRSHHRANLVQLVRPEQAKRNELGLLGGTKAPLCPSLR